MAPEIFAPSAASARRLQSYSNNMTIQVDPVWNWANFALNLWMKEDLCALCNNPRTGYSNTVYAGRADPHLLGHEWNECVQFQSNRQYYLEFVKEWVRDYSSITSAKRWVGADLRYYLCWRRWVGGPKKAKNMLTVPYEEPKKIVYICRHPP